ncbi:D-2-hydroxyacid dehydrogenase [Sporolactobacillus laevolacticus]|uniref:D-2-hydroxyacid dehydrogenase n=1 Tax=Sporolactobacillus laevolacticus TaxID=33018 RepID=UPI0025B4D26A|nr:D-2-hydroxyacid dehydrogenase [Sporolactobacillus laevolacticus]MDN3956261.1 D-2-hydroxyacid dehydrogenase [Sporolactobacillus laevolacticus]
MEKVVFGFEDEFRLPEAELKQLAEKYQEKFTFIEVNNDHVPEGVSLEDAVAYIGAPSSELLKKMPHLRWLQLPSAGANHFANHPDLSKKVILTNSSGVFGVLGAEHTLALILALTREIPLHVKQTEQRLWKLSSHCLQLDGATAGIVGYGDIGSEIAHRLKAFGARILAVKRTTAKLPEDADAVFDMRGLDEVLSCSDFVINVLPFTNETDHLFNEDRFRVMKPGTIFINVGRGGTVDEKSLIEALKSGRLGGAGLDVTAEEPLPKTSDLWDLPNVLITSHSLGVGPGKDGKRNALIKRNLENFSLGKTLENIVDRKLGY